jgi:hypothetical protein
VEGLQGTLQWLKEGVKSAVLGSTAINDKEQADYGETSSSHQLRTLVQYLKEVRADSFKIMWYGECIFYTLHQVPLWTCSDG